MKIVEFWIFFINFFVEGLKKYLNLVYFFQQNQKVHENINDNYSGTINK